MLIDFPESQLQQSGAFNSVWFLNKAGKNHFLYVGLQVWWVCASQGKSEGSS